MRFCLSSVLSALPTGAVGLAIALAGCKSPAAINAFITVDGRRRSSGAAVFEADCARCHYPTSTRSLHGPGLQALTKLKAMPSGAPPTDERLADRIQHGYGMMPGTPTDRRPASGFAGLPAHTMSGESKTDGGKQRPEDPPPAKTPEGIRISLLPPARKSVMPMPGVAAIGIYMLVLAATVVAGVASGRVSAALSGVFSPFYRSQLWTCAFSALGMGACVGGSVAAALAVFLSIFDASRAGESGPGFAQPGVFFVPGANRSAQQAEVGAARGA